MRDLDTQVEIHQAFLLAVEKGKQKEELPPHMHPARSRGKAGDGGGQHSPNGPGSDLGILWSERPC